MIFVLLISYLWTVMSVVGEAKYFEEKDEAKQTIVAASGYDEVLVKNPSMHRWISLKLFSGNAYAQSYTEFDLTATVESKDDPHVSALGIFFNHDDDDGRAYFPDKDDAVFFHNRLINYKNYYMEETIELHAEELRNRIMEAEFITIKVKMEDRNHKFSIYSFDLPAEALNEWKKMADRSLGLEARN